MSGEFRVHTKHQVPHRLWLTNGPTETVDDGGLGGCCWDNNLKTTVSAYF